MGAASSTLALLNNTGARPPASSKASAANAGRARPVNPSVLETGIGWARMLRPSAQVCLPGACIIEMLCRLPEAVLTLFCGMPLYNLQRPVAQRVLGEDRSSTAATGSSPSKALATVCLWEEVCLTAHASLAQAHPLHAPVAYYIECGSDVAVVGRKGTDQLCEELDIPLHSAASATDLPETCFGNSSARQGITCACLKPFMSAAQLFCCRLMLSVGSGAEVAAPAAPITHQRAALPARRGAAVGDIRPSAQVLAILVMRSSAQERCATCYINNLCACFSWRLVLGDVRKDCLVRVFITRVCYGKYGLALSCSTTPVLLLFCSEMRHSLAGSR